MPRDLLARQPRDLLAGAAPPASAPSFQDGVASVIRGTPLAPLAQFVDQPLVQQGASGLVEGAVVDTLSIPNNLASLALSIGPMLTNKIFGTDFKGPEYLEALPDAGRATRQILEQNNLLADAPTDPLGKIVRNTTRVVGGAMAPEATLTAKAGGSFEDFLMGLFPAATAGASGGVVEAVAPDNEGAKVAAELIGGLTPSTVASTVRRATTSPFETAAGVPVPKKVVSAVERDQVPVDQVGDRVADLGPAAVVADVGDNTQKLAAAVASQPGQAGAATTNAMRERSADSMVRVPAAVTDTLGPARPPSAIEAEIKANKKAIGPDYDVTKTTVAPVDVRPIAAALDEQIQNSVGPAQSALRSVRKMLDDPTTGQLSPDPDKLHQVREAIDGMIEDTQDGNVRRLLGDARKKVDELLTQTVPPIGALDDQYHELSRQGRSLEEGAAAFDKGKQGLWPEEMRAKIDEAAVPAGDLIGPSGAAFRLSQGARSEIERIIGQNVNDRAALASLLGGGESDWNPQKLAQLFGQEKADEIVKLLQNERQLAATENLAVNGSKTAAVTAAQRDLNLDVPRPSDARGRTLTDLVLGGVDKLTAGATSRAQEERAREIVDIILGDGKWQKAARPFLTDAQLRAQAAAVIGALGAEDDDPVISAVMKDAK
jgi:hypothetical protein